MTTARSPQLLPGPPASLADLLGTTDTTTALTELVGEAVGRTIDPATVTVQTFPYEMGSPATGGLYRITGSDAAGAGWSLFCKVLHHLRHWPALAMMPPQIADQFAAEFPWRSELELWDERVQRTLPAGLRSPVLHRVAELGDDRIAVWQEDIAAAPQFTDIESFGRAGYLLGRWNARSTTDEALSVTTQPTGIALRMYAQAAVPMRGLAPLADDELWHHPWLVGHRQLRADLLELSPKIPEILDRLDCFVQAMPHGDASPQNLLVPADRTADSAEFVVIDLSFRSPHALGFDLGQLLVGLVHAGLMPASALPRVAAVILANYLRGVADEGLTGQDAAVRAAFVGSVLLRSGFDGLRYDLLDGADPASPAPAAFTERIAMSEFLVRQYRQATA